MNTLEVQVRSKAGKGSARAIRRAGAIPAILYGGSEAPETLSVDVRLFSRELGKPGIFSRVFSLMGGAKKQEALVRDIQFHPVTSEPLHIDFFRVDKMHPITVKVPVVYINEAASPGLKSGGVLNVVAHEMEISCSLKDVPSSIEVDLTGLNFHDTIHAHEVKLPENVSLVTHGRDQVIAAIVAPTIMPTATDTATAEAAETDQSGSSEVS
jgi:large subunit ribosomal protein L25